MTIRNILSLDGGGSMGIVSAVLVDELHKQTKFLDKIDLFAGTSIGAANAAALAEGKEPHQMVKFYTDEGCAIFGDHYHPKGVLGLVSKLISHIPLINTLLYKIENLFWPKWDNKGLEKALDNYFGKTLQLKNLKKKLLILATKLDGKIDYVKVPVVQPVGMTNFANEEYQDLTVHETVFRSMSAPVYFESHSGYVDGGVFATNPCIAALSSASIFNGEHFDTHKTSMLSIGCGIAESAIVSKKPVAWGLLRWAIKIFPASETAVLEFDALQCKALMGDNFFRLNITLPHEFALDDCTKLDELRQIAMKATHGEEFKQAVEFVNNVMLRDRD